MNNSNKAQEINKIYENCIKELEKIGSERDSKILAIIKTIEKRNIQKIRDELFYE